MPGRVPQGGQDQALQGPRRSANDRQGAIRDRYGAEPPDLETNAIMTNLETANRVMAGTLVKLIARMQ